MNEDETAAEEARIAAIERATDPKPGDLLRDERGAPLLAAVRAGGPKVFVYEFWVDATGPTVAKGWRLIPAPAGAVVTNQAPAAARALWQGMEPHAGAIQGARMAEAREVLSQESARRTAALSEETRAGEWMDFEGASRLDDFERRRRDVAKFSNGGVR